jgi:lipoyl-dependent peroxiredoxin
LEVKHMAVRTADAHWQGTLKEGTGHLKLESGAWEGPYTWRTRFGEEKGANPEELIAAAHSGCFTMFLSALLTGNGTPPESLDTTAKVHIGEGPTIFKIELHMVGKVPGITAEKFAELAAEAKAKCPVSKALAAVPEITLDARLA